jgi:hypothetical protein
MVHRARRAKLGAIWTACAIWACSEGSHAPPAGEDVDPASADDGGFTFDNPAAAGGRADAGKDAGKPDAGQDEEAEDAQADAAPDEDGGAPPESGSVANAERLLIADGLLARLYVYDVTRDALLDSFTIDARARVYAGSSGRYGYALRAGGVDIVDMGLTRSDTAHGSEPGLAPPALLADKLLEADPSALLAHAGQVAVFFATKPQLQVLRESQLGSSAVAPLTLDVGAPHRGFGLPFGDGFIATRGELGAVVLRRYLASGALDAASSFDCSAPEGPALRGGTLAVGCDAGVLLLDEQGAAQLVPYPTVGPARMRRLVAHPSRPLFLGLWGEQLCLVDSDGMRCVSSAEQGLDYAFDASGKRALLLTRDGAVRVLDADGLGLQGVVSVTSAVPASDEFLEPQLAVGLRYVYVSDPQLARVQVLDPATRELAGELQVPGAPARLAVFNFHAPP